MKIKLLVSAVTMSRAYDAGSVVDWPDRADAERLIRAGVAEAVTDNTQQAGKSHR